MAFTVIAHRGHRPTAPENTVDAFQAAVQAGFPHVETDVQLTQDGVCIVLHDEQLGRTCSGSGAVADHTWAQLRDRDVGSWYAGTQAGQAGDWAHCRIPTLEALLTDFKGRIHLHLELKSKQPALPSVVAQSLEACGWVTSCQSTTPTQTCDSTAFDVPGLTITSFHLDQLRASSQLIPHVRHGWLVQDMSTPGVLEAAKAAGVTQLCPRADLMTAESVAAAKAQGFTIRAWGLKTHQAVEQAVRAGAQGGTSDWPEDTQKFVATLCTQAGSP